MDLAKFAVEWAALCRKIAEAARDEKEVTLTPKEAKLMTYVLLFTAKRKLR